MKFLLPKFTKGYIEAYLKTRKTNPGLLFYRYLTGIETKERIERLHDFINSADTSILCSLLSRQEKLLQQWRERFGSETVQGETMELVDRMVIGIGHPSSFENSILLHRIHGIPYVNGEAIKGTAKSYAWDMITEKFKDIFGSLKKEAEENEDDVCMGKVVFFDAFPEVNQELFDIDVVTSHYNKYYTHSSDTEPLPEPGDWYSLDPVSFLAIRKGVKFRFAVASLEKDLATQAWKWLKDALIRRGIGAKKHIGYGHFSSV
ncbi:MAG: type III-B CRISPR module RAMP protein Cmr6 [Candidatus Jettenia sp. CY-1]|nr:MAG: type III-B CRISPR module RAMP protein Cmr6 [Candidatus Jettenia sp. CY-1]